jgi:hypothetical protein
MRSARWYAAVAAAGVLFIVLLPLSPALASRDMFQARLVCTALTVLACAGVALSKGLRQDVWIALSIASATAGVLLLLAHFNANSTCVAAYNNRSVVVGRAYTAAGADYVSKNGGLSASDLLLDAGGVADRIWTPASISSCRFWISWGGLLAAPLFAACVGALMARREFRFAPSRTAAARPPAPALARHSAYDAFLSYRHTEPDRSHASTLLEALESQGLRVAIDFRDFAPNQHFLSEMERCIKESRFVLCVVTPQYIDSGQCAEEAIICKTLDMADRTKRLVPLIFDRVELPVWLYGLVGIDFSQAANIDPLEHLLTLLQRTADAKT